MERTGLEHGDGMDRAEPVRLGTPSGALGITSVATAMVGAFWAMGAMAGMGGDPTGYEERGPGMFMLLGPFVPVSFGIAAWVVAGVRFRHGHPRTGVTAASIGIAMGVIGWCVLALTWNDWF